TPDAEAVDADQLAALCAAGEAQIVVPNVAGMSYAEAEAALVSLGLHVTPIFEDSPLGATTDADPVTKQGTAPGAVVACDAGVTVGVAFQPGPLHVVQDGESLASISEAGGPTVQELA
ncbi:MAG TPA: PASTA domain-containing protein, partial [Ilumatobacteraceae bacterium]|nr:PASTA domain-containing protein [Ilumatobacteraceae bacterium]